MAILFIRTVILYFITLFAIKVMGKRELGQLHPFELVVLLIVSEMASLSMQNNTMPMVYSVIPILTITLLQIFLSLINLHSDKLRALLCGRPSMLIKEGRLCEKELLRQRVNINDLQEMARSQGYFDLSGIDYALLETNGSLSILPRTSRRPLETGDIMPRIPAESFPCLLILDGHIDKAALQAAGRDKMWLEQQLRINGQLRPGQIFIAGLNNQGQFFFQQKLPPGAKS